MKVPFAIFLSVLVLFGSVLSQVRSEPELIDEFGLLNCDDFLARRDHFMIRLSQMPSADAIVVLSGSNDSLIEQLKMEVMFKSSLKFQYRAMESRIKLLYREETGRAKMQFYMLPRGSIAPTVSDVRSLKLPADTKAQYFMSDSDPICSYATVTTVLRDLLSANPRMKLNIVVPYRSARSFRREKVDLRDIFGASNSPRLRFFSKPFSPVVMESNEYWIVP